MTPYRRTHVRLFKKGLLFQKRITVIKLYVRYSNDIIGLLLLG